MKHKYITTPIYYANGSPHLGHAYTTIVGDAYKKYFELQGYEVMLVSGCDEHGQKIQRVAEKKKIPIQKMVDNMAKTFKECWAELELNIDKFVRTTDQSHKNYVRDVWNRLMEKGYIYFGQYNGLYCVGCEQYYKESELLDDNVCPVHNTFCEEISEDSYFFKLSEFRNILIQKIKSDSFLISPQNRKNEVLSFLEGNDLRDLSISRNTFSWGIPVPNSDSHVMYVWLDALFNYISILDGDKSLKFNHYWSNTTHLLGKDILRFHAVYWPAFLIALEIDLPKKLLVHGWWKISNKKISKSDPATKVNPLILSKYLSKDGFRYILLKDGVFERDSHLDYQRAFEVINADLANNLGNLVNRVSKLILKFFKGTLPTLQIEESNIKERGIKQKFIETKNLYVLSFEEDNPSGAIGSIIKLCNVLNLFINNEKPWEKIKIPNKEKEVAMNLAVCLEGLRWVMNLGYPFFPDICKKLNHNIFKQRKFSIPQEFILNSKYIYLNQLIFKRLPDENLSLLIEKIEK